MLIFLVFFAVVSAGVALFKQLSYKRAQRDRGIQLLQALRVLVNHLQVHRGLTGTYLGGNASVQDNIVFLVDSISNDINNIISVDESIRGDPNWQGITQHWAKLSSNVIKNGIQENYKQHCKLVASCLEIMLSISKLYHIKPDHAFSSGAYWHKLLCLGESLGQLRALGVMYLASSDSSGSLRYKENMKQCIYEFERMFGRKLQQKLGRTNCEAIDQFMTKVDHHIIRNRSWVSSEEYFSRATETIEIIYDSFDEEMIELVRR